MSDEQAPIRGASGTPQVAAAKSVAAIHTALPSTDDLVHLPKTADTATDSPGDAPQRDAIANVYRELQAKCGSILHDSLQGEFSPLVAKSHIFLHELEHWCTVLTPHKERHLLAVAAREYQYSLLALAQGLYRQAFKGLRLVLELCLQAVHLSVHQVELQEWLESRKDTVWAVLMDEENGVLSVRFARAFFPELEVDVRHHRSMAQQLYRECSECVHGSMQKYIPLPESLIFSPDSFRLWHCKANSAALVVAFALALRYLRDDSKITSAFQFAENL